MKPPRSRDSHRHRLVLITATITVLMSGIGLYGLIVASHNNTTQTPSPPKSPSERPSQPPAGVTTRPPRLGSIPRSSNPETFARNVASAIFGWDTASSFMPLDYTAVILEVGDPTGTEQAGLAADIATYLPTRQAWIDLRQYATTQRLEIERAYVPDAWADALAQARPGQLPEGAVALTIEGIRHREGIWHGDVVVADRIVAFTVFIACPPTKSCHLLRLSQLDNPLR